MTGVGGSRAELSVICHLCSVYLQWRDRRGSNPRPRAPEARALPTELRSRNVNIFYPKKHQRKEAPHTAKESAVHIFATELHVLKNPAILAAEMRKTKLFLAVQQLLGNAGAPLSVPRMREKLCSQGLRPNKTTLYRMLSRLCKEGMAKRLNIGSGADHYEAAHADAGHGHFVCTQCDAVQCLPPPAHQALLSALPAASMLPAAARVTGVELSLQGLCTRCV